MTVFQRAWVPYVVPMLVYLAFLQVQSNWPDKLPIIYPLKTVVVAALLWQYRKRYVELRRNAHLDPLPATTQEVATAGVPSAASYGGSRVRRDAEGSWAAKGQDERQFVVRPGSAAASIAWGVLVGVVAIVIWIGIDPYYPHLSDWLGGAATPFDPFSLPAAWQAWAYIAFRVFGAVVVVSFMEEIFWRGFLIRWIVREDFQSVPLGTFTWPSFLITVALFGVEHNEWLAGLICGVLYNLLLYRTRSLWACIVAHATSNALLATWVLARADWKLW